jgi:hypothetical protein
MFIDEGVFEVEFFPDSSQEREPLVGKSLSNAVIE